MLEEFGRRLREAREVAGVNQSEFAEWGGAKRNSQIAYESGKTAPSVEYLYGLAAHGVDIGYLVTGKREGKAAQLLDEADALIEAGDDDAVLSLRRDLERIARDPDIASNLRNRALYLVGVLGGEEARRMHGELARSGTAAQGRARETMEAAIEQGQRAAGVEIGEGVRQAILGLAGHLLIVSPEDISPGMLDWSIQSLVRAIAARLGAAAGADVSGDGDQAVTLTEEELRWLESFRSRPPDVLHDRRPEFRGRDRDEQA